MGTYETVPSKYKPWEPAGLGGRECLRPLVSPSCHKVISTLQQRLPLGLEQRILLTSQMENRAQVVLLWGSPKLNYLWPWSVWGFEPVRRVRPPAGLCGHWRLTVGSRTKALIHSQSYSNKIGNSEIKEMNVSKYITFFCSDVILKYFFFWEDITLKVWKLRANEW